MKLHLRKNTKKKIASDFLEPEEILFNKEALSKLEPDEDIQRLEVEVGHWGLKLTSFSSILFLAVMLGLIFYFSVVRGAYFQSAAEKNSLTYISVPAERGLIYDRNGEPLVYNKPVFDLVFFPNYLPLDEAKKEELFNKIQECCGISSNYLNEEIKKVESFLHSIVLKSNLTNEEAISLESFFGGFTAVQVIEQDVREYESPLAFSHLLGYLGRVTAEDLENDSELLDYERIGRVGLESTYEDELRGVPGQIMILRNATMEILGQSSGVESQAGNNLNLTIDKDFQEYLYQRLKSQINYLGGDRGALAIAINSSTGEVLALVSYPGFNSNSFSSEISQSELDELLNSKTKPLFNRVISGTYNPGSTIKPLVAAMALEENIINPEYKLETHGYISIANPYNPDNPTIFPDWKNHGYVDMKDALARSSNVYFYTLGGGYGDIKGLGIEKLGKYFDKFGLDEVSGIDLPNEQVGFIPGPETKTDDIWRIGDTYHVSIGQGDLSVTPIKLLIGLNSLVNGGKILKPYLVKDIVDGGGNVVKEFSSQVVSEGIISKDNLEVVQEGMIDTVKSANGTGHTLSDLPFTSGGKSGTAQVSANTKVNALFFAFAPAENPKISLLVLIENAKEGALNAIPVVKDALLWYYQNRGL